MIDEHGYNTKLETAGESALFSCHFISFHAHKHKTSSRKFYAQISADLLASRLRQLKKYP